MDHNTQKLLEQLAAKLGTTTEYLWGILLKHKAREESIKWQPKQPSK